MTRSIDSLRRRVANALQGLPPLVVLVDVREGEPNDTARARRVAAEGQARAARASGRRACVVLVDMDEERAT